MESTGNVHATCWQKQQQLYATYTHTHIWLRADEGEFEMSNMQDVKCAIRSSNLLLGTDKILIDSIFAMGFY